MAASAYQWLPHLYLSLSVAALVSQSRYQSISGWLIYLSAYQWLPQPISGWLIYLSAYQGLPQPISGCLIYLSLSMATASISAYQWLYWLYLSLSVAALVSQSRYQSISGWLIYLSAYQWLPPFTLGGTVGCCLIRGRGWSMQP